MILELDTTNKLIVIKSTVPVKELMDYIINNNLNDYSVSSYNQINANYYPWTYNAPIPAYTNEYNPLVPGSGLKGL